jgi:chromosomal replication initiation ATPase DnaA
MLRDLTHLPMKSIGAAFGRCESSIGHAYRSVSGRLAVYPEERTRVALLRDHCAAALNDLKSEIPTP